MNADGKHVLLIDDDADMHDAVKMILEVNGYRVTCYPTGPAGLEAIRQAPPDLILLDIMLSSPTEGFELAAEIRADAVLARIPLVMLSSLDEQAGSDFAREAGTDHVKADRFIEKPLDAKVLLETIHEVLQTGGG